LIANQEQLLEEGDRLDKLRRSYDGDDAVDESYVVLTIGASLIATLGLLANNAAVVIGAMVVAPWILPLRALVFGSLIGDRKLLLRAVATLAIGVAITTLLSMGLGLIAGNMDLLRVVPKEITARLQPNLLDLGIALAAGAIATYAKVNPGAVSSMAGTAIAVALVPPVCVMGIMLAAGELDDAQGAGLLFSANLLGILIGGIIVLATREPYFREKLRTQNRSRLPLLIALVLAISVGEKLYGRLKRHVYAVKIEDAKVRIEGGIRSYLKRQTTTFGNNKSLDVASISFDWPDYWERHRSPQLQVVVRVTDPTTPSYKQVQYIQDRINEKMGKNFPNLKLQMKVLRINMTVVSGKDVTPESTKFNLQRILGQDTIQDISLPETDIEGEHKTKLESPTTKLQ
jgi:uncharacterized hydrophobic protein (TIGR00271 family)